MADKDRIKLEILTPDKAVLSRMVEGFTLPGKGGRMGILYNHAPLVALLEPGLLEYTSDGEKHPLAIGSGIMEIRENKALVLVDKAELPQDIDIAQAAQAEAAARAALSRGRGSEQQQMAWQWENARLKAGSK